MNHPVSTRSYLISSTACLLAFASQVAAQNSEAALERRVADLEQRLAAQQGESGSSASESLYDLFKRGRAEYRLGEGLTFSAQDEEAFSINIGGQVQAGFTYTTDDPTDASTSNFAVWSSRLRVGGNVFHEDITYFVQMDPSATTDLVDAWVGWRVRENLNLRLGQQKMRSSLQADTSHADTDLEMATRSIATNSFANQRAVGALLEGKAAEGKFNWHAGVMNNGTAGVDANAGIATGTSFDIGGVIVQTAGFGNGGQSDVAFTAGGSYGSEAGNSEDWSEGDLAHSGKANWIAGATVTQTNESVASGGDALTLNFFGGFKSGSGFAAQGEYFMRDNDDLNRDDAGFYVQGSYTLPKRDGDHVQWGGVFRYSMVDFDGPEATEIAAGINAYYHEHNLKTQLQVRNIQVDNAAGAEVNDTIFVDLLFTLVF